VTLAIDVATRSALAARAEHIMPGGVSSPVRALKAVQDDPLFIARGSGARVISDSGASYIDYIGSWGAGIVGHAHPAVVEAVARAARDGLGFGATSRLEVELAETIVARVPGVEQLRFVCSGTEAVMSAIRLARAATGRATIVKFEGGYHGHADALLVTAGSGVATFGLRNSPGVPEGATRDTLTLPYNDIAAVHELFARQGDRVACVIVEPVAGNMGVVPANPEFLAALRSLTRAHGALLIFDEVMTGFRVAFGGAQQLTGIEADLVTLGKIVGGGLPVAAYAGRAELMQLIAPAGPVYQAGTLAGNPVGMAAGLATLHLLDSRAYAQLEDAGGQLELGLQRELERGEVAARVQRVGSMLTLFFGPGPVRNYDDARRADHDAFARFFRRMRREGVLLPPSGFESWFISLAHGPAEISGTIAAVARVLNG
jgi:glutamate-1-semialdehyde 2,1-aminomutase